MTKAALAAFAAAYDNPDAVAASWRAGGGKVIRHLGTDVPLELLRASGMLPVRLTAIPGSDTSTADRLSGTVDLSWRGRSVLQQLYDQRDSGDAILFSHANEEQAQLFGALREFTDWLPLGPIYFSDLLHRPRDTTRRYNETRLLELRATLEHLGGKAIGDDAIQAAIADSNRQKALIERIVTSRVDGKPWLSGVDRLRLIGAAAIMDLAQHVALLEQITPTASLAGRRLYVTGSTHQTTTFYAEIEALGAVIVGEDHDWGDLWYKQRPGETGDGLEALAEPNLRIPMESRPARTHAAKLAAQVAAAGAEAVLHLNIEGDQTSPWEVATNREAAIAASIPFVALTVPISGLGTVDLLDRLKQFLVKPNEPIRTAKAETPPAEATPAKRPPPPRAKSRKSLASVASFGTYQREWFADTRRRAEAGEPLAVVNANAPQEILRALDIPFVVNQWWAAIVAAKQQSTRYLGLLTEHHFPTDTEAYSAQGLAAAFETDAENAPWGGLPRPTFLHAVTNSDPTAKIFEHWTHETDAELYLFERTVDPQWDIVKEWWDSFPDRWDETLEPARLELLVAEIREVIGQMERKTGRHFDMAKFAEIMTLVNEQEDYYRKTRDLIARTYPAPAGIVDTMPATMVPQWHRGSVWARDAAKAFYEEVLARAEAGEAACPGEKIRLMWIGRGMWSDMGFYQQWEESHGAVFVWSMYLSLAADGYIRTFDRGRDPLRALAARIVTMGDELRMPSWAAAWHVREAQTHGVNGALALSDADPVSLRALEQAGIPVLRLGIDNYDPTNSDAKAVHDAITDFIETRAANHVGGQ